MTDTDLYKSMHDFAVITDDEHVIVHKGDLVRKGHPIMKGREQLFVPAEGYVRFDVEQATAGPGEKRRIGNRKRAASKPKAAKQESEKKPGGLTSEDVPS